MLLLTVIPNGGKLGSLSLQGIAQSLGLSAEVHPIGDSPRARCFGHLIVSGHLGPLEVVMNTTQSNQTFVVFKGCTEDVDDIASTCEKYGFAFKYQSPYQSLEEFIEFSSSVGA